MNATAIVIRNRFRRYHYESANEIPRFHQPVMRPL